LVFLATAKGRDTREFLVESRFELRKVVWPTRQEALRMTWVVGIVVVVLSLLLGAFDWIIQALLEQFFTLGR
ncbi:MAG TPA: preprotein translocase subunit SecE, partial [Pseudoxanthomonas sp.]|nr:preprotein translocase subunit SecE [Pseudoxanthomonas sp.]